MELLEVFFVTPGNFLYLKNKSNIMISPLSINYSETKNVALVTKSLNGDHKALDALIKLHQPFIYNVAWKMTNHSNDAMDLTQEVLIKVITKLSQFKGKSAFRTWLYRMVVNEFLQTKRRPKEDQFENFNDFDNKLNAIPDGNPTSQEKIEQKEFTKEVRTRCMSGMLMCLTREQRLIYILGDTFGIDHNVGSEIFEISKQNYRIRLSRARTELHNFMEHRCGLVKKSNTCRCSKKTKALRDKGVLTKDTFVFNVGYKTKIAEYVEANYDEARQTIDTKYINFFREHPSKDDFGAETVISEIINDKDLWRLLN
jgi:RNA polymerase sigma factor (sigma-70 family)